MHAGQGQLRRVFSVEHSKAAYLADFALLFASTAGLATFLVATSTRERWIEIAAFVPAGLAGWTLIEYVVHRFVLHGLRPFSSWHALHHRRQTDLIYAPTILTAAVITGLVFLPAWMLGGLWRACALMLGLLSGYAAYSVTHHAVHHRRGDGAWLRRRKRWHSLHHRPSEPPGRYGVTTAFWDHVFRTKGLRRRGGGERRLTASSTAGDQETPCDTNSARN
jgi:sterol desaturase/sphingolipid hydroxylase (fatty acid hydroxylase superfamily)